MRRAIACALAMVLLAGVPTVAFAEGAERDTQTDEVEVAVEGDNTADASKEASSSKASTTARHQVPATGDDVTPLAVASLALGVSALTGVGVAAKRAKAAGEE